MSREEILQFIEEIKYIRAKYEECTKECPCYGESKYDCIFMNIGAKIPEEWNIDK